MVSIQFKLVRKAMIRFGLALNTNRSWQIKQLFQHLQDTTQRYPIEFAGSAVEKKIFVPLSSY